jgi:PqqD family protein of HPr-rel-A system
MSGPRWIADPDHCFRTVALDGLTAIYHRPSGMTHILAAPAPQLLALLGGKPADLDELAMRLGEAFELEQAEALETRLIELEAAGLVYRA